MSTAPPTMVNSTFGVNRVIGLNFINRVLLRTLIYLVVNREQSLNARKLTNGQRGAATGAPRKMKTTRMRPRSSGPQQHSAKQARPPQHGSKDIEPCIEKST